MSMHDKNVEMENKLKEEIRKKEEHDATEVYKEELKKNKARFTASLLDKLLKGGTFIDPKSGKEVSYWDDANAKGNDAMGADVYSYNDWRAAMMYLVSMFSSLNKAIHHSIAKTIYPIPVTLAVEIGYKVKEQMVDPVLKNFKEKLAKDPECALPSLEYLVDFSDDNKLKVGNLMRSDKKEDLGEMNGIFKTVVHEWLNQQSEKYRVHPDDAQAAEQRIIDANGAQLSKADFVALKNDPVKGLDAFLKDNANLNFTPQASPRP